MTKLSEHFTRGEFACRCQEDCGKDTVDIELLQALERLRGLFNKPIKITSANRCAEHNKRVGGRPSSQHLLGKAADIQVSGIAPRRVQEVLKDIYPDRFGIGSYETFTHIDVRGGRARW